ncbi:hypothetical protein [Paludibacterium purpuratum]|uniref:Uncharacterized protein n=1 Tax=Paludibacterium purpuratum TaxID=1144873 RepID=A0A4R7AYI0_9NEIS|nr:hypothetical protein [Paludibacterium purpuratum]TDR71458.1 hypothetical protein DFP86_11941 [Paludibacterium purpuratum]
MIKFERAAQCPGCKYLQAVQSDPQAPWHTVALLDADAPPVLLFPVPAIKKTDPVILREKHIPFAPSIHTYIN